jgi:hypothetical protein
MAFRKPGGAGSGPPRRPPEQGGGKPANMGQRFSQAPRPRVHPQMNTDTRRHEEKAAYSRRGKYREDLLDEEELQDQMEPEDGGSVLEDYPDEPDAAPDDPGAAPPDDSGAAASGDPGAAAPDDSDATAPGESDASPRGRTPATRRREPDPRP